MNTHSNCRTWALAEYIRLHRAWVDAGRQIGAEPYLMRRATRLRIEPTWWFPAWLCAWITDRIPHYAVGGPGPLGLVTVRSFVPEAPGPDVLHPTQLLRVLWFPGRVVAHDCPPAENA